MIKSTKDGVKATHEIVHHLKVDMIKVVDLNVILAFIYISRCKTKVEDLPSYSRSTEPVYLSFLVVWVRISEHCVRVSFTLPAPG
jgi:hypothetical protein